MTEVAEKNINRPILRDVSIQAVGDNAGQSLIPILDIMLAADPTERPHALVLVGEVSGATPATLNPKITELVEKGIAVFVVSGGYAPDSGIREIKYETQDNAQKAGAIHLRNANLTTVVDVGCAVQTAIDGGKRGAELNQAITDQFGTPDTNPPPDTV